MRHTFASRLAMAGVDLLSICKLLGHQTLTMTMRYAHFSPGYLAQAVGKLVGFGTDTKTSTTVQVPQKKKILVFPQVPSIHQLAVKTGP